MKVARFSFVAIAAVAMLMPLGSLAQELRYSPEEAGITPISGDILIGGGYGNTHKYAAAWPAIMPDGQILIAYPRPTDENIAARAPFVDFLDRQGNIVNSVAAYHDDDGNEIIEPGQYGSGSDTRGIMIDASRSGESRYVVSCRLSLWSYEGPLVNWGSNTWAVANNGVSAVQVYDANGVQTSPVVNGWKQDLLYDDGDIRARSASFLSNGNIVFNWWDQKAGAVTGLRYVDEGYAEYENSGQVVGITVISPDGEIVVDPKPVSAPSDSGGSAQTMRGTAAGDGWFCCRSLDPDSIVRYYILNNDGTDLQTIEPVDALVAAGLDATIANTVVGGRGDSELPWGEGDYLYTIGHGSDNQTYIAKWNAPAGTLEAYTIASQNPGNQGERMDICTDGRGNIFCAWEDWSFGGGSDMQIFGRFFNPDLTPYSDSFAVYENAEFDPNEPYNWKDVSCRMDAGVVVVTCHTEGLPENVYDWGESSLEHCARLLENPFESSVNNWELH